MQRVRFFVVALAICTLPRPATAAPTLAHLQELKPGIFASGFSHSNRSANTGWIAQSDQTLLIDLPPGLEAGTYLTAVKETGVPQPFALALTRYAKGDEARLTAFLSAGVERVFCSKAIHERLTAGTVDFPDNPFIPLDKKASIGDGTEAIDFIPLDGIFPDGAAALHHPDHNILFTGPVVSNGPHVALSETRTDAWVDALRRLEPLSAQQIIPGFGSWEDADSLKRQLRYLVELRRQVGYLIALGRPRAHLQELTLPADYLVWMPYDRPNLEDFEHVYEELTVPSAPYGDTPPVPTDERPHALVLLGDGPHEPGHLEEGLRPVFEATGVTPHFTVDVRALTEENLSRVALLVFFRDGLHRPHTGPDSDHGWMTPEQEKAIVAFVEKGGGFLNLHNSLGLYPENGPYLELIGGRYAGHGPLERFQVEVVDPDHPVTRGVTSFRVADEQHTPPFDEDRCHLLLRNRSDDGKVISAAGWTREPGRGRLCYLANGHTREALRHPMVQQLMRNAVNWLLDRDVQERP